MPDKSPIQKLQDTIVEAVSGVVADPAGTAAKAAEQLRGVLSLGLTVAGQVAEQVAERINSLGSESDRPAPGLRLAPEAEDEQDVAPPTPADVARVAEKKAPAKKAPARKTAKKTPSAKLPAKKTPAKKTPAKKTSTKTTPAKKTPAKKAAPKAAAAPRTAEDVLEDTSVTTPVGTTGADVATNPDTTDTDLQQVGTEPIVDPATTKAVASEAEVGARSADVEKG